MLKSTAFSVQTIAKRSILYFIYAFLMGFALLHAASEAVLSDPGSDFRVDLSTYLTIQIKDSGILQTSDSGTLVTFTPSNHGKVASIIAGTLISGSLNTEASAITVQVLTGQAQIVLMNSTAETFTVAFSSSIPVPGPVTFNVTPGVPDHIVITTTPSNFTAGGTQTITAELRDSLNNTVYNENNIEIKFTPSGSANISAVNIGTMSWGTLGSGSVGAMVANGVASVSIQNTVAQTFTIAVTNNGGVTNPASISLDVTHGSPAFVSFSTPPGNFAVGESTTMTLQISDVFNNVVTIDNSTILTITPSGSSKVSAVSIGTGDGDYTGGAEQIVVANGLASLTLTDNISENISVTISNNAALPDPAQNPILVDVFEIGVVTFSTNAIPPQFATASAKSQIIRFSLSSSTNTVLQSVMMRVLNGNVEPIDTAELQGFDSAGNLVLSKVKWYQQYDFSTGILFSGLNYSLKAGSSNIFSAKIQYKINSAGNTIRFGLDPTEIVTSTNSSIIGAAYDTGDYPITDTGRVLTTIAAGRNTFYSVTRDGNVLGIGRTERGQLGRIGTIETSAIEVLPASLNVVSVAAGADHAIALTSTGEVYGFGSNIFGQSTSVDGLPVLIAGLPPIQQIACGAYSSYALGVNGNVFSWGRNNAGQLGCGDLQNKCAPVEVILPYKGVKIAGGADHVLFLCKNLDRNIYGSGSNGWGQLGQSNFATPIISPILLGPNYVYLDISAGGFLSFSLNDSIFYSWGRNDRGQLASSPTTTKYNTLGSFADSAIFLREVVAGYQHVMVLNQDGLLYIVGDNTKNQLGERRKFSSSNTASFRWRYERALVYQDIKEIAAGPFSSMVKKMDGSVVVWGEGINGQAMENSEVIFEADPSPQAN